MSVNSPRNGSRPEPPELLAPAGDWDALRAAVANGADAVYFGLSDFNARHRAANFTLEELPEVMQHLRRHNVRGYVTLNTLIFSDELPKVEEFIRAVAQAGVDALIVQDLGLVRLIRRLAPGLSVHGSTQMTLTEPRGIELVKSLGVERVILARELSAVEIGKIAEQVSVPVEVFIHGALCISYSGQCLTSESLGGRSANRGQCAQACRLPYELIVDGTVQELGEKAYLLSPQDLAAHDLIDDLVKIGVCSFKIEGRLKSAHYVAATTQTYRAALDAAIAQRPFVLGRQEQNDLQQSFSRGFTHGFLGGVNHQTLVPGRFPKSRGVRVGTVIERTEWGVVIEIPAVTNNQFTTHEGAKGKPARRIPAPASPSSKSEIGNRQSEIPLPLKPGDGVVFDEGHPEQDEQGGRVFTVRAVPGKNVTRIEITLGDGDVNLSAIAPGSIVWKTDDPALRRRLEQSFNRDTTAHRQPLHWRVTAVIGQPLRIEVRDEAGHQAEASWPKPLEIAQKHPLSLTLLREQLSRLGDTPYTLGDVELFENAQGQPCETAAAMVPKSVLNDLRRQAVEQLVAQRESGAQRPVIDSDALAHLRAEARQLTTAHNPQPTPSLYVLARSLEQVDAVLAWAASLQIENRQCKESHGTIGVPIDPWAWGQSTIPSLLYCDFEDVRQYPLAIAKARAAGVPIALATVRIIKPGEEGLLAQLMHVPPDAVLVRNLAALSYFRQHHPELPLIADYTLNVANELTAAVVAQQGVIRMAPSYDLSWPQLAAMLGQFDPAWFEAVIHQHMPMFHMEHCVFAATLSNGKDHRDCGRPCDRHDLELRDRVGQPHPLVADVGCRNTVFNAQAQSAAGYVPRMKALGLRHFRVELLRETPEQARVVLDYYARLLADREDPRNPQNPRNPRNGEGYRSLRVISQLGVTAGTLDFE